MTVASLATITHSRPLTHADPGDDPGAGRLVVVQAVRGQRRQLQKRGAGVEQAVDALARQQLAAREVALPRALAAAERGPLELRPQVLDERRVGRRVARWNSPSPG